MRKILHPKKGSVPLNFNENSIFQEKSADKNKNFHVTGTHNYKSKDLC